MRHLILFPLFLAACGAAPNAPPPPDGAAVTERIDVSNQIAFLVGVSIAPDGVVVALDAYEGLFSVSGDSITLLSGPDEILVPELGDQRPYTDVAAMSADQFVITVLGDGLLLDRQKHTTEQHFCYEPGGYYWVDSYQLTDSVAYDAISDRIYANPQSFSENEPFESDLAWFDGVSGTPLVFRPMTDSEFRAGAIAFVHAEQILMGSGSVIYLHGESQTDPTVAFDLAEFGVGRIDGLAYDADSGDLWVADGYDNELVRIAGLGL